VQGVGSGRIVVSGHHNVVAGIFPPPTVAGATNLVAAVIFASPSSSSNVPDLDAHKVIIATLPASHSTLMASLSCVK
jgi:hypothetical protein